MKRSNHRKSKVRDLFLNDYCDGTAQIERLIISYSGIPRALMLLLAHCNAKSGKNYAHWSIRKSPNEETAFSFALLPSPFSASEPRRTSERASE